MLKVVDVVYYNHDTYTNPLEVIIKHYPANGFIHFLSRKLHFLFVKHLNYEAVEIIGGVHYAFFKRSNRFWTIPLKTHRYIRRQHPDVVIVEGLIFPLQLMMLKRALGRKTKIIAQHHGELPFRGLRGMFQRWADRAIDAYVFTSLQNAGPWMDRGIIKDITKCKEVLESSTSFKRMDRALSQEKLGMNGTYNYVWVGRLNQNKDPLTILQAFEKYARYHSDARLFMIYQEADLLREVQTHIRNSEVLRRVVKLVGKVDHHDLIYWFSACNFYVSGSHREGSGYALLEAMACGCIPLVTAIPSFEKITGPGKTGFLYPPGNTEILSLHFESMHHQSIDALRKKTEMHFREHLSFKNIAEDLYKVITQI